MHEGVIAMAKIAALAVLLTLTTSPAALADPNLLVWRIAHERMLAKWRHAEPRCGHPAGNARHQGTCWIHRLQHTSAGLAEVELVDVMREQRCQRCEEHGVDEDDRPRQ